MSRNPDTAALDPRARAIVDYALKLTRTPASMQKEDVETLRRAGLDDGEILDVCQVASYYAFVNRLAQGLGVELESHAQNGADAHANSSPSEP